MFKEGLKTTSHRDFKEPMGSNLEGPRGARRENIGTHRQQKHTNGLIWYLGGWEALGGRRSAAGSREVTGASTNGRVWYLGGREALGGSEICIRNVKNLPGASPKSLPEDPAGDHAKKGGPKEAEGGAGGGRGRPDGAHGESQNHRNRQKKTSKTYSDTRTRKSGPRSADLGPLRPENIGFRTRVSCIQQNPTIRLKGSKSLPKADEMGSISTKNTQRATQGATPKNRVTKGVQKHSSGPLCTAMEE